MTGREVPYSLDAEESLLGAMLLNRDAIAEALEVLTAQDFYSTRTSMVFSAVMALYARGEPADAVTVAEQLSHFPQWAASGDNSYLITLQSNTPSTANAGYYAHLVRKFSLQRQLIDVGARIVELGYEQTDDIDKTMDAAEALLFRIADRRVSLGLQPMNDLMATAIDDLEARYEGTVPGIPTGYVDLDKQLMGLQPSNLVIIAARPSMGKSSLALGIAVQAEAKTGLPVAVFSFEMSSSELVQRLLSSEGRIDGGHIRTGSLNPDDWHRISETVGRLGQTKLFVDDDPTTSVMAMRAKARRLKAQVGNLGLIIVDYLQLMESHTGKKENRQVEVAEISRGLKILARELDVPVVAMSQLSRNLEQRADKRPMLSDLRESGALEQDADVVLFIYRDEVYNPTPENVGHAEIIVAKHRNGPTGTVELAWFDRHTRFASMTRDPLG